MAYSRFDLDTEDQFADAKDILEVIFAYWRGQENGRISIAEIQAECGNTELRMARESSPEIKEEHHNLDIIHYVIAIVDHKINFRGHRLISHTNNRSMRSEGYSFAPVGETVSDLAERVSYGTEKGSPDYNWYMSH